LNLYDHDMKIDPIQLTYIPSGQLYKFTIENDIGYEVGFARKVNNILHTTGVFGVHK